MFYYKNLLVSLFKGKNLWSSIIMQERPILKWHYVYKHLFINIFSQFKKSVFFGKQVFWWEISRNKNAQWELMDSSKGVQNQGLAALLWSSDRSCLGTPICLVLLSAISSVTTIQKRSGLWALCKWNKSDQERQILYDLIYMWNVKKKLRDQICGC